jgi:chromosomal replication initiator protein
MDSELKNILRDHLLKNHSADELRRWYDPLRLMMNSEQTELSVVFPHSFFSQWFAGSHQERFEQELHAFFAAPVRLRYGTNGSSAKAAQTPAAGEDDVRTLDYPFGREFAFSSFVQNNKNAFPIISAREVAKQTDPTFNPFIVCGPSGSGKTHLLKAMANEMARNHGRENVFFGSVEDLLHLYEGECGGDAMKARAQVCGYTFLLVDDLHLLKGHRDFQSEILTLFDSFYDARKQMVFGCLGNLPSYDFLDPKLKSRLEWGLIVALAEPDLEVRLACVERFCRQKQLGLSRERQLTVAQRFTDLRFLQGVLLKLYAYKEFVSTEFSDSDFDRIIAQSDDGARGDVDPQTILDVVAAFYGLSLSDLKGARRHHNIVRARQVAMYLSRDILQTSYPALGRQFGGRDHSTALYAVKKVRTLMAEDVHFKDQVETLRKRCLADD